MVSLGKVNRSDDRGFKVRDMRRRDHSPQARPCCSLLATRIWNRTPFCVDLVKCEVCGFMFYNPRLDDGDLRRLYGDYRSKEYQQMRHASEPWYTTTFNFALASPSSYEIRRARLAQLLRQHLGQRKISRILDYGGDRGDLVVGLLDGARRLYTTSQEYRLRVV